jgi:hypothetical protein
MLYRKTYAKLSIAVSWRNSRGSVRRNCLDSKAALESGEDQLLRELGYEYSHIPATLSST